ncbi:MAG: non-homologous end-joining DNA ligase, partial [Candidatus Eremiobacteraeota bacterium]|nr:non-homologous end-joining DNA ligase [Candidatus Eremiobacteraeota bacterium]
VMASWAVPKGPSLDPAEKRLAMHVEDHPVEYNKFEGNIPKGHYGAGAVILWDRGTYALAEGTDPATEIANGKIKFYMFGKRLRGMFTLVRIKNKGDDDGDPWLLIKDTDKYVVRGHDAADDATSVKSGKTIEEIAADPKAKKWISPEVDRGRAKPRAVKRDPLPKIASPMLATVADAPFDGDDWLFEIKWDGYRAICSVDADGKLTLVSRNGLDLLKKFPELADLAGAFRSIPIVVDGEIVSLDTTGRSSFGRLHDHGRDKVPLTFVAFDLLYADGRDRRKEPLEERKALLQRCIADEGLVMFSKHVIGSGVALFEMAAGNELEGIVAKKRASLYEERRTRDWLKIKAQNEQEFVVGGWTEPQGSRKGFGALLLGAYVGKKFRFVGSVGSGFDAPLLREISAGLRKIARATSPFDGSIVANAPAHFVEPLLVVQVRFTEWTKDEFLRQPTFLGIRDDKPAKDVVK